MYSFKHKPMVISQSLRLISLANVMSWHLITCLAPQSPSAAPRHGRTWPGSACCWAAWRRAWSPPRCWAESCWRTGERGKKEKEKRRAEISEDRGSRMVGYWIRLHLLFSAYVTGACCQPPTSHLETALFPHPNLLFWSIIFSVSLCLFQWLFFWGDADASEMRPKMCSVDLMSVFYLRWRQRRKYAAWWSLPPGPWSCGGIHRLTEGEQGCPLR